MISLTLLEHIAVLLQHILFGMILYAIGYLVLGTIIGIRDIQKQKRDDIILYNDDRRCEDFLAEVYLEFNTEEY